MMKKAEGFLTYMEGRKIHKVIHTKDGRQEIEAPQPPTVTLLAEYLKVHRDTVYKWAKDNEIFSDILEEVQRRYEQVLIENGLTDRYNANLAKFLLSADHGKREKTDTTTNGKEISASPSPVADAIARRYEAEIRDSLTKQRND